MIPIPSAWLDKDRACTAPEAAALATVLSAAMGEEHVACGQQTLFTRGMHVFSYRSDFGFLWNSLAPLTSDTGAALDLVIVWDGAPTRSGDTSLSDGDGPKTPTSGFSQIPIAEYVTVFDWVAAFCSKVASTRRLPQVRAFILDVNRSSSSFGASTLPDFLPSLPWLRIYRPVAEFEEIELIAETCCGDPDIDSMLRPLLGPRSLAIPQLLADLGVGRRVLPEPERLSDQTLNSIADVVARLRRHWTNELTKPETRHSVSNLVAPFALAAGLRQLHWPGSGKLSDALEANDPHRRALKALLSSVGLFETPPRQASSARDNRGRKPLVDDPRYFPTGIDDPFARFEKVDLLLVDDQYALGYEAVLRCLLFGDSTKSTNGRVTLTADDSPDQLLSTLYATVPELREPDTSQEAGAEQAFLRRLLHFFDYTGACRQLGESARALTRAARAARKLIDPTYTANASGGNSDTGRRCPQCGIDREHHSAQFDWSLPHLFGFSGPVGDTTGVPDVVFLDLRLFNEAASGYERPDFDHHLLLPLLISHVDPSLPIILFSSTQQRAITEAFAQHPNIITTFSKPLVSGYVQERTALDALVDIKNAMWRALRLHNSRLVWMQLNGASYRLPMQCIDHRVSFKVAKKRIASVDAAAVARIAREYRRLFPQRHFADALAVPGNVLEWLELTPTGVPELPSLGAHFLRSGRKAGERWYDVLLTLMSDHRRWPYTASGVKVALGKLAHGLEASGTRADRRLSGRVLEARTCLLERRPVKRRQSWLADFAARSGQAKRELVRSYGSVEEMIAHALDSWESEAHGDECQNDINKVAAYQFYWLIGQFRHLRAHYSCRPGDGEEDLEEFANLVWNWLFAGATAFAYGRRPIEAATGSDIQTLEAAWSFGAIPGSEGNARSSGAAACRALTSCIAECLRLGLISFGPDMKPIEVAVTNLHNLQTRCRPGAHS